MNIVAVSKRSVVSVAFLALATVPLWSCGSVTSAPDGGTAGAAGSQSGGTGGAAGGAGTQGAGGTSAGGTSAGGMGGAGGSGGSLDGGSDGPIACRMDQNDCPTGFTCACGGAGPGMCTCHRNCTDAMNQCPAAEPMCGCPGTTSGSVRFCVNACFCTCN